jgi:surface antigen
VPNHLGSFLSPGNGRSDGGGDRGNVTGSIAAAALSGEPDLPMNSDLAVARETAADLLEHDGEAGAPWENPLTGARGTIMPVATAYRDGGIECRDFLASYVHDNTEIWLQGEACRNGFGHYQVRDLKPWRRS